MALLAGTALVSGCQTLTAVMARAASPNGDGKGVNCFKDSQSGPDFAVLARQSPGEVAQIAARCEADAAATDSKANGSMALFNAGKANLGLAMYYRYTGGEQAASDALSKAAVDLQKVVVINQGGVAREKRGWMGKPRTGDAVGDDIGSRAGLELARVYRLQPNLAQAKSTLDGLLAANPKNAPAKLELARVYLALSGNGASDDRMLETAVGGYYDFVTSDLKGVPVSLVNEGRQELVENGRKLGQAMMRASPSPQSNQRAVDAFDKAKIGAIAAGSSQIADLYVELGQAKLRLAGLQLLKPPAEFDCTSRPDDIFKLDDAVRTLRGEDRGVVPDSAQAHAAIGCALEAKDIQQRTPPNSAVLEFKTAVDRADTANDEYGKIAYRLLLAQAFGAANREAEAEPVLQKALEIASDDPSKTALIHVEIARSHLQKYLREKEQGVANTGDMDIAKASAYEAVAANKNYPAAYLMRGRVLFENRAVKGNAALALKDLDLAAKATAFKDKALNAEASYYLSLLEMEMDAGDSAVRHAMDAVTGNGEKEAYRDQACLVHIRFLTPRRDGDARTYCGAGKVSSDPKARLFEGLYHLRSTYVVRSRERKDQQTEQANGWEWALNAFQAGLGDMGAETNDKDFQSKQLRARLVYGQGYAYRCIGLFQRGREVLTSVAKLEDAANYFDGFGVRSKCADRR